MIFISYAREDRERVGQIIAALSRHLDLEVWSDRRISIGTSFTQSIATALVEAWVVVVLWTKDSTESEYVLDESRRALKAGKLVPVRLDDVEPPLGFGGLQGIDLLEPPPVADEPNEAWHAFLTEIVTRISEHVQIGRIRMSLDAEEWRERHLAAYFARARRLSVVCGLASTSAVLPFYWSLAMIGFKPTLAAEPLEASGQDILPILEDIDGAERVLLALYPLRARPWFIELCRQRAGAKARFVLFGSLTPERARTEYPALATEPDDLFIRKQWMGCPLKGEGVIETWNTIQFILDA